MTTNEPTSGGSATTGRTEGLLVWFYVCLCVGRGGAVRGGCRCYKRKGRTSYLLPLTGVPKFRAWTDSVIGGVNRRGQVQDLVMTNKGPGLHLEEESLCGNTERKQSRCEDISLLLCFPGLLCFMVL